MSAPEGQVETPAQVTNGTRRSPELDISKLHSLSSEQQELYLLNFVYEFANHVKGLEKGALVRHQPTIKRELIKIVGLSSPVPSRVTRNCVGRVFVDVLTRGSHNQLFETINDLLEIANIGKSERELKSKHTAIICLGHIYQNVGGSAVNISALTCATLLRILKQSQNHTGLRGSVYAALAGVISGIGASLDEQTARDIYKQARIGAANEKAYLVQLNACACLENLIKSTPYFDDSNYFDTLKSMIWKVLDSPVARVRNAAAITLAAALVKAYSPHGFIDDVPTIRKPKKTSKKPGVGGDEELHAERPASPSSRKAVTHVALSLRDICRTLSTQYCKASTTNRSRAGLISCYKSILHRLPLKVVEDGYGVIANHLFVDILSHPTVSHNRHRLLISRRFVAILLEDILGSKILNESSQVNAARWLVNDVLKNYPAVLQDRREPTKRALTAALSALARLMTSLGSAISAIGDICREALFQVLQHPNYTVQIHVAHCFRAFVLASPAHLLPSLKNSIMLLKKEMAESADQRHSSRKAVAYARALAAMLSTYSFHPLYSSADTFAEVFQISTDLLKGSGASELRTSAMQVQIAWLLIGGLMPLGPSFAKVHLPQLLLLWRNALSKPLPRENAAKASHLESSFLAHVRECALGALHLFLDFNSSLITADSSKRIATMLQNCVLFLDSIPNHRHAGEAASRLLPALQLQDFVILVRRRILQCFSKLVSMSQLESHDISLQSNLVNLAISSFTAPESGTSQSFESSIAASAGSFETLWDLEDNWGFGVTGRVRGFELDLIGDPASRRSTDSLAVSSVDDASIASCLQSPVCTAREHEPLLLCYSESFSKVCFFDSPPTQVVNSAIELFAITLPLQPPKIQESCLEQLATIAAQSFQREPGKRAAILVNTSFALLAALVVANRETRLRHGRLAVPGVDKITAEMLRRAIANPDPIVRHIGAEAFGRLTSIFGSTFTGTEVDHLVETIVANRDPDVRAGCALSLGCIHFQVGGMAASFHLKTMVSVLLSLCSDPHPRVHYSALEALSMVADSAGLTFSAYVTSSLGLLAQLYNSDSHTDEAASVMTSNAEIENPTLDSIGHCVDSLINVLGPDLQDVNKARALVLTLVGYFRLETFPALNLMSVICSGRLSLYAPASISLSEYIRTLQAGLLDDNEALRETCIKGLSNAMKRNVAGVLAVAKPGLDDEIWLCLDLSPTHSGLQSIIENWLLQSYSTETADWVQRCHNILSKPRAKTEVAVPTMTAKSAAVPELQDEEVAGFAAAAAAAQGEAVEGPTEGHEFFRWQTRIFAMSVLSELLDLVEQTMLPDQTIPAENELQNKIADIVRMAFSASTSTIIELRTWGLRIIDQIMKLFGKTPDPDFVEASLLEQYQAQIGSALTPAFAADSSPELAAEAISVCATFVSEGIVTNVERMGRIFRLLVTGLESNMSLSSEATIGDLKGLSPNGQVMLRMAILSAWAHLQVSSADQPYLVRIVQPYLAKLTPLWLAALEEYARLRFEPEISSTLGGDMLLAPVDNVYASLNRETRLKFYQDTWLSLVDAIAMLVDKDSDFVFEALDNKANVNGELKTNGDDREGRDISYREEPVAFFFILYGLSFEALVVSAREDANQTLAILQALRRILRPSIAGNAVYRDTVFGEILDTFGRLALTADILVQAVLVEIAKNLALNHPSASDDSERDEKISDDIDQLFELTRIIFLVLAGLIPTVAPGQGRSNTIGDKEALLALSALEALVEVAEVFPEVIRVDLYAGILNLFCTIIGTGICQAELVPKSFPIFRQFLRGVGKASRKLEGISRIVRGCITQMLTILRLAQRRENEFAVPCAKNTLLAMTIVLTSAGRVLPPNDPSVSKAVSEMLDCLQDLGLGKVAVSCLRTILLANPKSLCEEAVCRFLYPKLIDFINDTEVEDPEDVKELILQALASATISMYKQGGAAATFLLIPILFAQAEDAPAAARSVHAGRLLEVAAAHPLAFKATVLSMSGEERTRMQEVLRSGSGPRRAADKEDDDAEARPAIELRMDF